jgi:hypothetical protein
MGRIPLPLLTLAPPSQVCRVRVAELVAHLPGIALIKVSAEGDVPCATGQYPGRDLRGHEDQSQGLRLDLECCTRDGWHSGG